MTIHCQNNVTLQSQLIVTVAHLGTVNGEGAYVELLGLFVCSLDFQTSILKLASFELRQTVFSIHCSEFTQF